MSENKEPKVAAGESLIAFCPLCGVRYVEPIETVIKQQCPENGGCGLYFSARVFEQ